MEMAAALSGRLLKRFRLSGTRRPHTLEFKPRRPKMSRKLSRPSGGVVESNSLSRADDVRSCKISA